MSRPEAIYDESAFIDGPVAGPPCYWAKDPKVGRYHVPGCMGAAVYGPRGCTCGVSDRKKFMEQKLVELERRVAELEAGQSGRSALS